MDTNQLNAATEHMVNWLSDQRALGKKPAAIQCAGEFDFNYMHYYIFKFKKSVFGKWLVGVCGGFEKGDLEPCGHTFSEMKEYNKDTAESECLQMIFKIMNYWKSQAEKYKNTNQ